MNTQPAQLTDQPTVAMGIFVLNPFGLRLDRRRTCSI